MRNARSTTAGKRQCGMASRRGIVAAVLAAVALGSVQPVNALETRSYVVGWFSLATNSVEGDCSAGVHPEIELQYLENLEPLGYSDQQIEELRKKVYQGETSELFEIMAFRGRVDGEPVNPFTNPGTAADPGLSALDGQYAYGFDLDGTGGEAPNAFVDPETGEDGVDNEMYRALGCARAVRGTLDGRPTYWDWLWGQTKASQPAWLITVSSEDFSTDGEATIGIYRAVESLRSNSDGSPRAHVTYRIDPDARSHNEFHGMIRDGEVWITDHEDLRLLQNPLAAPEFRLSATHLRLTLNDDGTAKAFVGGYQPWEDLYFGLATTGSAGETTITGDIVGLYYLLRKHADADPDPELGINRAISTTYYLEAVPAFVSLPGAEDGNTLARN